LPEALTGQGEIRVASLPASLLEGVQHVNRLFKLCHVHHPMLDMRMDSNLVDTLPNARHGLPVGWHQATLDSAQVVAGSPPSFWGKVQQILEGGPNPDKYLIRQGPVYKWVYSSASDGMSGVAGNRPGGIRPEPTEQDASLWMHQGRRPKNNPPALDR